MIDPVCGMSVEKGDIKSLYKGKTYYFCSKGCKTRFDRDPEKYLKGGPEGMSDP
ncbi:YHS domain-containing protein [Candidatus Marsarchaeota G2 archaeon OSP_D]|jgi:Uncharacterized conserved protein|uniref:YHS domain-containing protein n=4 Tax=Candidatus Marsarchaeota group 2 TaxID=2203771 RepID=A0A2R6CB35_9ARCH|nr:MAG: YHS domain-containing protein [Candidatus Marsarchaeota G2 archaeon ECH_B_SAG-M15]PSN90884.1 MAG: YHS domain-containing protein [Candidatus Marsarchaeota G2 archaeon OSP_D]PSO03043.1 MAG: YHS domain-containing protein [Candidatus Marsarchaeota G2 archaeon ECH_B_1]PSO08031.1 MAG: YHS domain-containing protein [Candidatus Marsarchaeota G2 archaeon BE_D]